MLRYPAVQTLGGRGEKLEELAPMELLRLHASVTEALRDRGVTRSSNNPVGDYAEFLFCRAFGWRLATKSERDADAFDDRGKRYQVKARRVTQHNGSRQMGILRDLDQGRFDLLAGVLFHEDYTVMRAALVPHRLVLENSKHVERTNGWRFILRDAVWEWSGVRDVTEALTAAEAQLG